MAEALFSSSDLKVKLQSGRTVGKMRRKSKTKPSSERRKMRAKNQYEPRGISRYPFGPVTIPADQDPPEGWKKMSEEARRRCYK